MVTFILFILIFGAVVIAHEFGHFLIAKVNGIHVVEFSVGMGPNLLSFKKGDTKYSLKLLPLGGACMFEGEDGVVTKDEETGEIQEPGKGAFTKAPVWARISTVFAGPFFNFILAFLVAFIMVNMSESFAINDSVVTYVAEGGAAQDAGLMNGDRIVSLNGERVHLFNEISLYMQANYTGGSLEIGYERDGKRDKIVVTPRLDETTGQYMIGIANAEYIQPKGFSIFKYTWYEVRYSFKATYKSLGMLFKGRVTRQDVAGPVGIAVNVVGATYDQAKEYGVAAVVISMLNIMLMLSVNLGILNLLPIPALDGGRLLFLFIEIIRGKPIPPEKEGIVHFIGLVFFMLLAVFIFFNDLTNIFYK